MLTARFMVLSGEQQKLWVINVVLRTPRQMNQEHLFAQLVCLRAKELPPSKKLGESSVALRSKRDPVGNGGVPRVLWEIRRMSTTGIRIKGE